MADRYQKLTSGGAGGFLAKRLGLPQPEPLRRHLPGAPAFPGPIVLGGQPSGRVLKSLHSQLEAAGAQVESGTEPRADHRPDALVFDATGIRHSDELHALHTFFHPRIRSLAPSGRLLVIGTPPEHTTTAREAAAQRALEGFVRSAGKELRRGATAQLLLVAPGSEEAIESTTRFVLSPRSAYVSGQVLVVDGDRGSAPQSWDLPLEGKTAVVTGASRGIGEVIAATLARDGAHVVCLDIAAQGEQLRAVAQRIGGSALELDVTAEDAPQELARELLEKHGGADIVVHNAGITRDKTLGRMSRDRWDSVLAVNLSSVERLNDRLLDEKDPVVAEGGRIVCVSSISGIAGNVGQTNYAASKAGLIGHVRSLAPYTADRSVTVNAVAPGFIETQMTAQVPLFIREAGRRLNSMKQGGQPVDVAEAVAYFASPASGAVTGQVLRVCGQGLLGA
ncbi:3-oxoacyl-ACP reductase [Streptomyces sp. XM4193]|uniref:3-oxoacyl-ACP reductase n=1 Tax=Streptomyces sp. XM4193 TaxID=2929782 RepID=UPI001FFB26C0|nr:3-oxoacyl-ACP reductase [Streptomyces sp. XM4193]MCK1798161.1 3-oxoacyl-ACP reductase [Streptomyces sp. XM4193]